jgi:hypothetical protein
MVEVTSCRSRDFPGLHYLVSAMVDDKVSYSFASQQLFTQC